MKGTIEGKKANLPHVKLNNTNIYIFFAPIKHWIGVNHIICNRCDGNVNEKKQSETKLWKWNIQYGNIKRWLRPVQN